VISCVIPVYNGKRHLRRAVDSVLSQRADVQVVLVDDGSTDGSRELVLELASEDRGIVALLMARNGGQGNARNVGVAAANAPYVTVLDQDDEHVSGWYDYAIETLDGNPNLPAIKGAVELMELPADLNIGAADPRLASLSSSVMWNVVARKVVFQALGGCPAARIRGEVIGEDVAFMSALNRHFPLISTDCPSTRHYVKPHGPTEQFFRRTRVTGTRFEFVESQAVEADGTWAKVLQDHQSQADSNLDTLRELLKPGNSPC
jgi:glycosyltransferase involved in cell wall biosynthesis